jgi:3'(2'), 5'-bisphosphate nucleotidase
VAHTDEDRLNAAKQAVADACIVCRQVSSELERVHTVEKDDRSPVTVADFASQAVVIRRLHELLGPLPVVAEETSNALRGPDNVALLDRVVAATRLAWPDADREGVLWAIDAGNDRGEGDSFWTLDPIDGTKGFLRGGQYAISLAFIEGRRPTIGLLGCPNLGSDIERPLDVPDPHGTLYFAQAGAGLHEVLADAPDAPPRSIRIDNGDPTAMTVKLVESVESGHSDHAATARLLRGLGLPATKIRADSQAKYAMVARGQANLLLRIPVDAKRREAIWDHAAGAIVASESGCIVTDLCGEELDFSLGTHLLRNRGIACMHPGLHARVSAALTETDTT